MAKVELAWNPFDPLDPGPCIDVVVRNSREVIEAGRSVGLDYPKPIKMRALLDTGASVTVISKTLAKTPRLLQTNEGSEISAVGAIHKCAEHAGSISFPGTDLDPIDPLRIVSLDFPKERYYAILLGRDILKNWTLTFDGRTKKVTITA